MAIGQPDLDSQTYTRTSDGLIRLGTDIYGVLGHLPDPDDGINIFAVVNALKNEIGERYEQDGTFHNPSFLATDYCREVEGEIMEHSEPMKPYEYILAKELCGMKYPAGATARIVMQMRGDEKSVYETTSLTSERTSSVF